MKNDSAAREDLSKGRRSSAISVAIARKDNDSRSALGEQHLWEPSNIGIGHGVGYTYFWGPQPGPYVSPCLSSACWARSCPPRIKTQVQEGRLTLDRADTFPRFRSSSIDLTAATLDFGEKLEK